MLRIFQVAFWHALFCLVLAIAMTGPARGDVPGNLVVLLDAAVDEDKLSGDWQEACDQLAASLTVGQGMFGLGIFQTHQCMKKDDKSKATFASWYAKVEVGAKDTSIKIYRTLELAEAGDEAMAAFTFAPGIYAFEILADEAFASMMGYSLLDQLPAMLRITSENFKDGAVAALEPPDLGDMTVPSPPDVLVFYSLRYDMDRKLWIPEYLARGNNINEGEKRRRLHEKSLDAPPVWQPDGGLSTAGNVLAHDHSGRKNRVESITKEIQPKIAVRVADLESGAMAQTASAVGDFFSSLGSSGYLGLRYGLPLMAGEVIDKSTFLGALAEIRSGVFDGLKVYYDYWPEVVDEINGAEGAFGGQRFILGYSLGLEFDSFITGIDVTPKAGAWTFAARFPFTSAEDAAVTEILEFKVKNAPSLELEFGIESSAYWYILRGWASRALSTSFSAKQATVNNTRAGLDLMIRGPSFSDASEVNISFLVFLFGEQVILRRSQVDRDADLELAIDNIEYSQAYAGGGFAISW